RESTQCIADHSLFIHKSPDSFTTLLFYIDELIIIGNNMNLINKVKATLQENFHIKDLGSLKYFLGLEITRSSSSINICQRKYSLDLLSTARLLGCKPASTPMTRDTKLKSNEGTPLQNPTTFRRLVGQLIYLLNTRPGISYSVQQLSQHMSHPTNIQEAAYDFSQLHQS
ncbi:unnamed protein product, partial [Vicia faba]